MKRFAGDYVDEGLEDVQISHYRLESSQQHQQHQAA